MARRDVPLNPVQLEVLSWVRDGCADGVYEDWSHRIVARALHNRGLVVVKGHGRDWSAVLTEDGTYYFEHGAYAPSEQCSDTSPTTLAPELEMPKPRGSEQSRVRKSGSEGVQKPRGPRKPGPVDQLMNALIAAPDRRTLVPWKDGPRYRQLAGTAKRFGRVPDGMRLSFEHFREDDETMLQIVLEPIPSWQTAVRDPALVRKSLQNPSDVVQELMDSETFPVSGEPRRRALRLLDALVTGARERDITVTVKRRELIRRNSYATEGPRRDEIVFTVNADEFRLWFAQGTVQVPHEPTARELARARRGYLFPDRDDVPDEALGIVIDGAGGTFWASSWKDADEHRLEDDLAQILEEMRLRHESLVDQRAREERSKEERRRQWERAREQAVVSYREHFVVEAMSSQAEQWARAVALRQYAAAVRRHSTQLDDSRRARAIEWAEQIEDYADVVDPLPASATPPRIPEPSREELKPFMGPRSPYGP